MEESGPGKLPQLMRSLQQYPRTPMPTPGPTPMQEVKAEIKEEGASPPAPSPALSGSKEGSHGMETPILFKTVNEKGEEIFHYWCP